MTHIGDEDLATATLLHAHTTHATVTTCVASTEIAARGASEATAVAATTSATLHAAAAGSIDTTGEAWLGLAVLHERVSIVFNMWARQSTLTSRT